MAPKRKYRWEEWFAKPRTVLVQGIDYNCSQSTMSQMVRNEASMRHLRVRVEDNRQSIVIEVKCEISHPNPPTIPSQHSTALAQDRLD